MTDGGGWFADRKNRAAVWIFGILVACTVMAAGYRERREARERAAAPVPVASSSAAPAKRAEPEGLSSFDVEATHLGSDTVILTFDVRGALDGVSFDVVGNAAALKPTSAVSNGSFRSGGTRSLLGPTLESTLDFRMRVAAPGDRAAVMVTATKPGRYNLTFHPTQKGHRVVSRTGVELAAGVQFDVGR